MAKKVKTSAGTEVKVKTYEPLANRDSYVKCHDLELSERAKTDPLAVEIRNNRVKAASFLRVLLARVYGHPNAATFFQWHIIPCITKNRTVGLLNIAQGLAHDTGVEVTPEVDDLGYAEEDKVYSSANNLAAGLYLYEGKMVELKLKTTLIGSIEPLPENNQRQDITPKPPTMPQGWRQIILAPWQGYEGDGHSTVPPELYENNRIVPKLVSYGLLTCYGKRGLPRRETIDGYNEEITPKWWPFSPEDRKRVTNLADAFYYKWSINLIDRLPEAERVQVKNKYEIAYNEIRLRDPKWNHVPLASDFSKELYGWREDSIKNKTPTIGQVDRSIFVDAISCTWNCSKGAVKEILKKEVDLVGSVYNQNCYTPARFLACILSHVVFELIWPALEKMLWLEPGYYATGGWKPGTRTFNSIAESMAENIVSFLVCENSQRDEDSMAREAYSLIRKQYVACLYGLPLDTNLVGAV